MSRYGLIMSQYGCIMSNYGFSDMRGENVKYTNKELNHRRFYINIKTVLFGFYLHAWRLVI